jgi:hypothetical protein
MRRIRRERRPFAAWTQRKGVADIMPATPGGVPTVPVCVGEAGEAPAVMPPVEFGIGLGKLAQRVATIQRSNVVAAAAVAVCHWQTKQ